MYCRTCKIDLDDEDSLFCPVCGKAVYFGPENDADDKAAIEKLCIDFPEISHFFIPDSNFNYDKFVEDNARRTAKDRQEQYRNKQKLTLLNVPAVDMNEASIINDAKALLSVFCPTAYCLGSNIDNAQINIIYAGKTKTGKVPKNAVEASLAAEQVIAKRLHGIEYTETGDSVICHIKYLLDGSINMADIHLWSKHIRHSIKIRRIEEDLRITEASVDATLIGKSSKKLFHNLKPTQSQSERAVALFDRSLLRLLKT